MAEKKTKSPTKKKKTRTSERKNFAFQKETIKFIENLSRLGHTEAKIASVLNIHRNTLREWKNENANLKRALETGRQSEFNDVMSVMGELAKSGKYPYLTQKYLERLEANALDAAAENDAQLSSSGPKGQFSKVTYAQLKHAMEKDPFVEIQKNTKDTVKDAIEDSKTALVMDQDVSQLDSPENEMKTVNDPFKD